VASRYDLGREFFRWEMAVAVAGSIIGINPFDQPDVEASKVETRQLTTEFEHTGQLPEEVPFFDQDGLRLYTDSGNASALTKGGARTFQELIQAHLRRVGRGDYVALLAYIDRNARHVAKLQDIREAIGRKGSTATCVGFGPRFLHSTGQAYKGGPNTGVFLQLTCDDGQDVPVPGQRYTFGVVKAAQARGDFQVLVDRRRRALRVHLGSDLAGGLDRLQRAVESA
jgi:transaldolase/glucose-6-phosphate isomerase